jgi:hypothetical protein
MPFATDSATGMIAKGKMGIKNLISLCFIAEKKTM